MKVKGFSTSAIAAGIKYKDRLDLGLIFSEEPVVTAGVFTKNEVVAAPLVLDKKRLKHGRAQAILVNSGCANACTGKEGLDNCNTISDLLARSLSIPTEMIQLSSTGVIGEQLDLSAFESAIPKLVENLALDNFEKVAEAIMTTDTVKKVAHCSTVMNGKEVTIMGMSKGSGMIMPNMATMLAFVLTDAQINHAELNATLKRVVDRTFNRITVDGDTSTNDMVLIMANGKAGNDVIENMESAGHDAFEKCLEDVLKDLALKIVADGEGATKTITVKVCGAENQSDALIIGRTVANSNLVKTAFFGEDANWGRILAAMGRSGVNFNPDVVDISFGDIKIVRNGLGQGKQVEKKADAVLKEKDISLTIDIKAGKACEEIYTCDFSLDYVKINADYRS